MFEKILNKFRKKKQGPESQDVRIALTLGGKAYAVYKFFKKIFWNLVQVVYNARKLYEAALELWHKYKKSSNPSAEVYYG